MSLLDSLLSTATEDILFQLLFVVFLWKLNSGCFPLCVSAEKEGSIVVTLYLCRALGSMKKGGRERGDART
jgi:hypothetical protein